MKIHLLGNGIVFTYWMCSLLCNVNKDRGGKWTLTDTAHLNVTDTHGYCQPKFHRYLRVLSARVEQVDFAVSDCGVCVLSGAVMDDGSVRTNCRYRVETDAVECRVITGT